MNFRTELSPEPMGLDLSYSHTILSMGSCFAERLGGRMAAARFDIAVNPLGIAYHPLAIARLLELAVEGKTPHLQYAPHLEQWHSFLFHSRFNAATESEALAYVKAALEQTRTYLERMDCLMLTFGTAIGYRHKETGVLVNNNHRYPASHFEQVTSSPEEIVASWQPLLDRLGSLRPGLKVVVTVSPVRHIRHSIPGNSLSKASLRWACHQLTQIEGIHYFPAYELLLDDLRDYRFYSEDLIHPSSVAETYIWEKWKCASFSSEALALEAMWQDCQRDLAHRPRNPGSEAHLRFLQALASKLQSLRPHLDVEGELVRVKKAIQKRG